LPTELLRRPPPPGRPPRDFISQKLFLNEVCSILVNQPHPSIDQSTDRAWFIQPPCLGSFFVCCFSILIHLQEYYIIYEFEHGFVINCTQHVFQVFASKLSIVSTVSTIFNFFQTWIFKKRISQDSRYEVIFCVSRIELPRNLQERSGWRRVSGCWSSNPRRSGSGL